MITLYNKPIMNIEETIKKYKNLDNHIENINNDIKNISDIHTNLCNTIDSAAIFNQFSIYIDDIHFQKIYILKEIRHIETLKNISIRKLYADLFRLYHKTIKRTLEITKETDNIAILKKYYTDLGIRIFNELDIISIFKYRDIENIYTHFQYHIDIMNNYYIDMSNNITIMKSRLDDGYNMSSFIIAYSCEMNKLFMDIKTYNSLFINIINNNINILNKLIHRSKEIADEINDKQLEYNDKNFSLIKTLKSQSSFTNTPTPISPNIIETEKQTILYDENIIIEDELKLQIDKNNTQTNQL
jgi:hypothetical protein